MVIAIVATVIVIITLVVVKTKQHKKQMFDCNISESESGALILLFNKHLRSPMRLNTDIIFTYKRRNLDPFFKTRQNQEVHLELSDFKAHSFNYFQFNFDFWFSKDNPTPQVSQEPCPESPCSLFCPFPNPIHTR